MTSRNKVILDAIKSYHTDTEIKDLLLQICNFEINDEYKKTPGIKITSYTRLIEEKSNIAQVNSVCENVDE